MSDPPDFTDPREYQDWLAENAEIEALDEQLEAIERLDRDQPSSSSGGLLLTNQEANLIIRGLALLGATRLGVGDPIGALRCTQLARRVQGR